MKDIGAILAIIGTGVALWVALSGGQERLHDDIAVLRGEIADLRDDVADVRDRVSRIEGLLSRPGAGFPALADTVPSSEDPG